MARQRQKTQLVGQLQRANNPPENVTFVGDSIANVLEFDVETAATTTFTVDFQHVVLVDDDTAGGAVTVNLPAAANNNRRWVHVKKLGTTGNVTIDANASELIDGATTLVISTQYQSYLVVCDGTGWHII